MTIKKVGNAGLRESDRHHQFEIPNPTKPTQRQKELKKKIVEDEKGESHFAQ